MYTVYINTYMFTKHGRICSAKGKTLITRFSKAMENIHIFLLNLNVIG